MLRASNHPTIQETHPRSLTHLKEFCSKAQPFSLNPKPSRRYLKKLSLEFISCPECESKDITFYGKSSIGTQKYRCKACSYQFVAQFDALFPRSKRRELFEREFMNNLKTTGHNEGCGRKEFWLGARVETLQMTESQMIKVKINKLLKTMQIQSQREYALLLELVIHEGYGIVTG